MYLWDLDDGGFAGVVLLKKSQFAASFSLSLIQHSDRGFFSGYSDERHQRRRVVRLVGFYSRF